MLLFSPIWGSFCKQWCSSDPDFPWSACGCLFPLGADVNSVMQDQGHHEHKGCTPTKLCPCVLQQPSAECALEKDARDLFKGTKLRRVLHVPLLALVWTYWFTFHFSQFWQVIWYWYFSFMSLRLAWLVQWKIVLLSGICEWRINFQTSVSTYLSLQHHQVKGWCICFCRFCCRDHNQPTK